MYLYLPLPTVSRLFIQLPSAISNILRTQILLIRHNDTTNAKQCNVYVGAIFSMK